MVNVYLVPTSTQRRRGGGMPPAPGWERTAACGVRSEDQPEAVLLGAAGGLPPGAPLSG